MTATTDGSELLAVATGTGDALGIEVGAAVAADVAVVAGAGVAVAGIVVDPGVAADGMAVGDAPLATGTGEAPARKIGSDGTD